MKITNFTSVREVLHNNYCSHNVIGLYHFMGISPRNLTLFTRRFLAGRCTQARYKTMFIIPNGCVQIEPHHLYRLCSRFLFNFSIIYLGKLILQHNLFMLLRLQTTQRNPLCNSWLFGSMQTAGRVTHMIFSMQPHSQATPFYLTAIENEIKSMSDLL